MIRATIPILYKGRDYKPGEILPEDDQAYVTEWIQNGSAKEGIEAVIDLVKEKAEGAKKKKAAPAAARAGRTGKVDAGKGDLNGSDLTGVIPRRKK